MNSNHNLSSQRKLAITISLSLVLMSIAAAIGYGFAFSNFYALKHTIVALGDLHNTSGMLRLTIAAFTFILVLDVIVSCAIFRFFEQVNQSLSLMTTAFRLLYTSVLAFAIVFLLAVLQLLQIFPNDSTLILLNTNLFLTTWSWALIVFGCHLFLLGILVNESNLFPKPIGYVTSLAGLCYFFHHTFILIFPFYTYHKESIELVLSLPMALGELLLAVYLIRFGFRKIPILQSG